MKHKIEGTILRRDSISRYVAIELLETKKGIFYIRVNEGEEYKLKSKEDYFIRLRKTSLRSQVEEASEFSEQELTQITNESDKYIENFCKRNCIKTNEIKVGLIKEEISHLREYSLKYFDEYIAVMYQLIKKKDSKIFFLSTGLKSSRILIGEDMEYSRSLIDEIVTMYDKELCN